VELVHVIKAVENRSVHVTATYTLKTDPFPAYPLIHPVKNVPEVEPPGGKVTNG
jgi:hypothetical protein